MIEFPNFSRSYDRTRHAVRFWGYDSAMETSFFINDAALRRIQPDTRLDESGFLNAFDSNRDLICAAAAKVSMFAEAGVLTIWTPIIFENETRWLGLNGRSI